MCAPRVPLVKARTQVLHVVVACRIGAVSWLFGLEVLFGVYLLIAEHGPAIDAVMGGVVAMHGAVESFDGRRFWSVGRVSWNRILRMRQMVWQSIDVVDRPWLWV